MTLTAIEDLRTRFMHYDLDSMYEETSQQQVDSINIGLRFISMKIAQYDPQITFTLTAGTNIYNIRDTAVVSRKVVRPYAVIINGNTLRNAQGSEYGLWTITELEQNRRSWRTDPQGTPNKAIYYNQRLLLNPTPSAAIVSGGNNWIAGTYMAADMTTSDGANTPDIPEELHPALAFYAAAYSTVANASEQEAWQRLTAYNAEWQSRMDEMKRDNERSLQAWGSTFGSDVPDYIWL